MMRFLGSTGAYLCVQKKLSIGPTGGVLKTARLIGILGVAAGESPSDFLLSCAVTVRAYLRGVL